MINIAYIGLSDDASSFYRCQGVFPFMIDNRVNFHDISRENLHSWVTYQKEDVVILQRPFSPDHLAIIQLTQLMGKKVIIDHDDDLLNVPPHNPAHEIYKQNRKEVERCLRLADEIWVSTEAIKNSFERFNKNIHVIPNAWNNYIYPENKKSEFNPNSKKVLYRGGHTHFMDIYEQTDYLVKIAAENPSWQFVYMGQTGNEQFFRANAGNNNVCMTNSVPFIQYMAHIKDMNPMVAICPLENHLLNVAKSNISWMETTFSGAAFFANKTLPSFNLDCILPISLLSKAISENHIATLKDHNERSWEYIKENLLLSIINQQRLSRILA